MPGAYLYMQDRLLVFVYCVGVCGSSVLNAMEPTQHSPEEFLNGPGNNATNQAGFVHLLTALPVLCLFLVLQNLVSLSVSSVEQWSQVTIQP